MPPAGVRTRIRNRKHRRGQGSVKGDLGLESFKDQVISAASEA